MSLSSLADINVHLPDDKIVALDADDDASVLDAERIIKGTLSDTFSPTVLASWDTPENTPEYIRSIAGRFVAALYYARTFAAEQVEVPEYAQTKYNEAMEMLTKVIEGLVTLPEVDDEDQPTTGHDLTTADFTPNADTVPGPIFTMGSIW